MIRQTPIEVDQHGQTIRGMAYRAAGGANGRGPAVLMLHGFSGHRGESGFMFVHLARALATAGITAVTFDFRNSGESDGSFDRMLVTAELDDAVRMTHWLRGQIFADRTRLGVVGFSLGGLLAACLTARSDAYRALVLIAPTTPDNLCRHAGETPANEALIYGPHRLHPGLFEDLRTLDPLNDIIRHPRPTLLIQGTGDTAVSPEVSDQYVQALRRTNVPVAVEQVPGANHGFTHPHWRAHLTRRVVEFLQQQLCATPAAA